MTSKTPITLLGGISPEQFINEYWQKKPLLIRQAIPNFECPVTSDELAGLAMEEDVESRIVQEQGESGPWEPQNGPFSEDDYEALPEKNWTLLVQQLDAWAPEINELKERFDFIPNWRFDDIMASYAPEGGSVGPHYDQYDVFLLQAEGKRHWRVGQMCDEHSPRVEGTPLRILKNFEESASWVLEPGDMLYLPPNIAHYGTALGNEEGNGDCITLSVGYKAPTHSQILSHFADFLLEQVNPHSIYEDADLRCQNSSGEISSEALSKVGNIIKQYVDKPENLKRWFGEFTTDLKNENTLQESEDCLNKDELKSAIESGEFIQKNEGSRFAYTRHNDTLSLFVDGNSYELTNEDQSFVENLCRVQATDFSEYLGTQNETKYLNVMVDLIQRGSLYFQD